MSLSPASPSSPEASNPPGPRLARVVGLGGAVALGLGSILGTGVYVSLGLGADLVGPWVVVAVAIAGLVAMSNGLSSAQLAASHPVSGGTYEYGHRYLHPGAGFFAGWLFLVAKSASAATAALGVAGYGLMSLGQAGAGTQRALALGFVLLWTWIVAGGLRRSNTLNTGLVACTLGGLAVFVGVAWQVSGSAGSAPLGEGTQALLATSASPPSWSSPTWSLGRFLEAIALMFVAFTGYGRVATLGEEVRDPARTIPKAVILTLLVTVIVYGLVSWSVARLHAGLPVEDGAGVVSGSLEAPQEATLTALLRAYQAPGWGTLVGVTAITAMAGVLLNLLLGLSRVLLAMARRGEMPRGLAAIEEESGSPAAAVWAMGLFVAALTLVGDVYATWSLSAFTVLLYYALTNLCALRLPAAERRYPRVVAWSGLGSCAFLALWVHPWAWGAGLGILAVGGLWRAWMLRSGPASS